MKNKIGTSVLVGVIAVLLAVTSAIYIAAANWQTAPSVVDCSDNIARPIIPTLYDSEKSQATELLNEDLRAQEILSDKQYIIERIGVWHATSAKNLDKIGAAIQISFQKPYTIDYNWPCIEYNESKYTSNYYAESSFGKEVEVSELIVLIDLNRGKVVDITPIATDNGGYRR